MVGHLYLPCAKKLKCDAGDKSFSDVILPSREGSPPIRVEASHPKVRYGHAEVLHVFPFDQQPYHRLVDV